jgi:hypothetical protein
MQQHVTAALEFKMADIKLAPKLEHGGLPRPPAEAGRLFLGQHTGSLSCALRGGVARRDHLRFLPFNQSILFQLVPALRN